MSQFSEKLLTNGQTNEWMNGGTNTGDIWDLSGETGRLNKRKNEDNKT